MGRGGGAMEVSTDGVLIVGAPYRRKSGLNKREGEKEGSERAQRGEKDRYNRTDRDIRAEATWWMRKRMDTGEAG